MRASEFVFENMDAAGGLGNKSSGPDLPSLEKHALKDLKTYPSLPSHYYDMYRFGVHMAGSPDNQNMDNRSSVANQLATLAYTEVEAEIIDKTAKEMNLDVTTLSSKQSKELPDVNQTSPIAKPKRNKYGI